MLPLGIASDAYTCDSFYGIDFDAYVRDGFSCLDYQGLSGRKDPGYALEGAEFIRYFSGLRREACAHGMRFSQLHALWSPETEKAEPEFIAPAAEKTLYAAAELECPYVVIHAVTPKGWDVPFTKAEIRDANLRFFEKLLPTAEKCGVCFALENLPFFAADGFFSVPGTLELIRGIGSDRMAMCLDTGHMNMFRGENAYDDIMLCRDVLRVLHIHDNNGQTDAHVFPFQGNTDWDGFCRGLHDAGFGGTLSLETVAPRRAPEKARRLMEQALVLILRRLREGVENGGL